MAKTISMDLKKIELTNDLHDYGKSTFLSRTIRSTLDSKYLNVRAMGDKNEVIYNKIFQILENGDIKRLNIFPNDFMFDLYTSENGFTIKIGHETMCCYERGLSYPYNRPNSFDLQKLISQRTQTLFLNIDNSIHAICLDDKKKYNSDFTSNLSRHHPALKKQLYVINHYIFNDYCFVITTDCTIICIDQKCSILGCCKIDEMTSGDQLVAFETSENRALVKIIKYDEKANKIITYILFEMRDELIPVWSRNLLTNQDIAYAKLYKNFLIFLSLLDICFTQSTDFFAECPDASPNSDFNIIYFRGSFYCKHNYEKAKFEEYSHIGIVAYSSQLTNINEIKSFEIDEGVIILFPYKYATNTTYFFRNLNTDYYLLKDNFLWQGTKFVSKNHTYLFSYSRHYDEELKLIKISAPPVCYKNLQLLNSNDTRKFITKSYFIIWFFKQVGLYKDIYEYYLREFFSV